MLRKLAVSAAAAGVVTLVVGSPAFAAGSWTYSGSATVGASSSNLVFTAGTVSASCTLANATGSAPAAAGTWGTPPGPDQPPITNLGITASGCATTNVTPQMTFNLTQNGKAQLFVTAKTVTTVSGSTTTRVTNGEIRGLSVKGTALGGLCTVQVDGPGGANSGTGVIGGKYTQVTTGTTSTGTIAATGSSNMAIKSASALCTLGGLTVGTPATLSGSFSVTGSAPTIIAS